jgi:NAD-dependent dihydropyrimidine dehydrogenase PreA subunit
MNKQIIFCDCQGKIDEAKWAEASTYLSGQRNISILRLQDLCAFAVKEKEKLASVLDTEPEKLLIACHTRAVKLLLEYAGHSALANIEHFDLRNATFSDFQAKIDEFAAGHCEGISSELKAETEWPSWFPLIDYNRCTACGQCADFCLFGVYTKSSDKVTVNQPDSCKNNCPACARICPQMAIVFPKYAKGGAICGSDEIDETLELQRQQDDLNEILGNDIYQALEKRKKKRQMILKNESIDKALIEREIALRNLKNSTNIPFFDLKKEKE